jgi:glycosyltransferase involved in cell wall biosynthesis
MSVATQQAWNMAMQGDAPLTVTVAICTRNRPVMLRRALAALRRQRVAPLEVLVVDNAGSADDVAVLLASEFPEFRYLFEPAEGLDFARNHALREAKGDVVAFTDDDAVVDEEWVSEIARAFGDPRVGACTGRVIPLVIETDAQQLFEACGGLPSAKARLRLPIDRARLPRRGGLMPSVMLAVTAGAGCNLAVRRRLALALGGFDEALDQGAALPGGGDADILWRVLGAGAEVALEPDAVVRHEHRRDMDLLAVQVAGTHRAVIALLTKAVRSTKGRERFLTLGALCWRLLKPGVRLLKRLFGREPLPAAILWRTWKESWQGLFAYRAGQRLAGERRGVQLAATGVPAAILSGPQRVVS